MLERVQLLIQSAQSAIGPPEASTGCAEEHSRANLSVHLPGGSLQDSPCRGLSIAGEGCSGAGSYTRPFRTQVHQF